MAVLMVAALSCSKDGGGDPEGTMNKTLMSHDIITGGGSTLKLGSTEVFMSRSENLWIENGEIAYVGQVKGLGDVKRIPTSGFSSLAAVKPGYGYVAKHKRGETVTYARIYVVQDLIGAGSGGVIGAEIKYQYPFRP